ncbi:hypothetical protein ACHQM5_002232 [Ranunculus cassubicifolius]
MLFKGTISSTKRFFKTTIQSFKSLLSGGYERLPKSSPFNPLSCAGIGDLKTRRSFKELDSFSADTTNQRELNEEKNKNKVNEDLGKFQQEVWKVEPPKLKCPLRGRNIKNGQKCSSKGERNSHPQTTEEGMVLRRLKQLELMDKSNLDHALDIEEVLHYYSQLTSPAYLEIVDRFFMQMYSDIFHPQRLPSPRKIVNRGFL